MDKQKNNYWHVLQVAVFLIMAALALSCGSSSNLSESDTEALYNASYDLGYEIGKALR